MRGDFERAKRCVHPQSANPHSVSDTKPMLPISELFVAAHTGMIEGITSKCSDAFAKPIENLIRGLGREPFDPSGSAATQRATAYHSMR